MENKKTALVLIFLLLAGLNVFSQDTNFADDPYVAISENFISENTGTPLPSQMTKEEKIAVAKEAMLNKLPYLGLMFFGLIQFMLGTVTVLTVSPELSILLLVIIIILFLGLQRTPVSHNMLLTSFTSIILGTLLWGLIIGWVGVAYLEWSCSTWSAWCSNG